MKLKYLYINHKKKLIISSILIVFSILFLFCNLNMFVSGSSGGEQTELSNSVMDILNSIDLSNMEEIVSSLDFNLFNSSVKDKVIKILNGEYFTDYPTLISSILSLIFNNCKLVLPLICTIIAIGILESTLVSFKKDGDKSSVDIIHFVCIAFLTTIILITFKQVLAKTNTAINSLLKQMELVFPILITLLASFGSVSTISILNPLVAVLTGVVSIVFDKLLYPIFFIIFIFTLIGNLTNNIKLDKLTNFFTSIFKWILGIIFTLFTGFLTIQGISAGKYDSVSIKATKFAMKSYIPLIGSYISDGMDFIVLGSMLIKNSVGLVGVFVVFFTIVSPILVILIIKLGLQLSSGIIELSGNVKMSNYVSSCSKILIYPIVLILGIALMYIITICLIMCTANIF